MDDKAVIRTYGNTNLPEGTADRPLVTFALFAYNQEKYIREAVEGAFSQTYSPLEIILSDDCSSDQTFEIMEAMAREYRGPHLVKVRRGDKNKGLIQTIKEVSDLSDSEYIIAAAGDDVSTSNRAQVISDALASRPLLLHTGFSTIDENGTAIIHEKKITEDLKSEDLNCIARSGSLYVGATGVWHKDLFRKFDKEIDSSCFEDLVLGYRAALLGRVKYLPDKLVFYRIGTGITTRDKNSRLAKKRNQMARIASLRQRWTDTNHVMPERRDLLRKIEAQLEIEAAKLAWQENLLDFSLHHLTKKNIICYILGVLKRRTVDSFFSILGRTSI